MRHCLFSEWLPAECLGFAATPVGVNTEGPNVKLRDSSMPEEKYWETLFDVPGVMEGLGIDSRLRDVVELGCGFGTFSIPIARRIAGRLFAFDIDPLMIARTKERTKSARLTNVVLQQRDVMESGFGLPAGSVDAALLFNILHCESPERLLQHASQVVRVGGRVLVIHWRYDGRTPRGPDLSIRPRPEQIMAWAQATGELCADAGAITLPPWHYGLILIRLAQL